MNVEIRMSNTSARNLAGTMGTKIKDGMVFRKDTRDSSPLRHSCFVILSSLGISSFVITTFARGERDQFADFASITV